ncbi:hypothetical protein [Cryobacterium sp. N21]|uniref:hypothetical protein n=1 Tax=Cryobacterium sp. N21 TaxID=2048289 RepID=UPI001124E4DB|nr:hypothetical protein [Cryobacterium sp. N21]
MHGQSSDPQTNDSGVEVERYQPDDEGPLANVVTLGNVRVELAQTLSRLDAVIAEASPRP